MGSCKLHKTAASLVEIPLIPTRSDLPVMWGFHCLDPVKESVKRMERGVEPTPSVKVKRTLNRTLILRILYSTIVCHPIYDSACSHFFLI